MFIKQGKLLDVSGFFYYNRNDYFLHISIFNIMVKDMLTKK